MGCYGVNGKEQVLYRYVGRTMVGCGLLKGGYLRLKILLRALSYQWEGSKKYRLTQRVFYCQYRTCGVKRATRYDAQLDRSPYTQARQGHNNTYTL